MVGDAGESVDHIQGLFDENRHSEVITWCEDVVARFADDDHPAVGERVAYALLIEGLSLGKLGRSEDAIRVYEDLVGRYGDSSDPGTRRHVAWACNNRGNELRDHGQPESAIAAFDELIARFGQADQPEIRLPVSWSLSNKAALLKQDSRELEAAAVYEELIARCDEGLDVELDRNIARCMEDLAWKLGQAGRVEQVVQFCELLTERFGASSDTWLRRSVLRALRLEADELQRLGQHARALRVYDAILSRFGGDSDVELRDGVAATLVNKAVLVGVDHGAEVIAAYDQALALLDQTSESLLRDRAVTVLLSKGDALWRLRRFEEALVVYDSAAVGIEAARASGGGSRVLWAALLALFHQVDLLCTLDRSEQARRIPPRLISLLGDVAPAPIRGGREVSEQQLAAAFSAMVTDGECWRWFEASGEEPPRDLMAERALELYSLSEPWALGDQGDAAPAAQAAANMLLDIADGYAMLSPPPTPEQRKPLPLPKRADSRWASLIRMWGVEGWAAGLGYLLDVPEAFGEVQEAQAEEELTDGLASAGAERAQAFLRFFLRSVYECELVDAACHSPTGREALTRDDFKQYATHRIAQARTWIPWVRAHIPEAVAAAIAARFMAQRFFLVSYGAASSSTPLFPAISALRDLLQQSDAHDWLLRQDVEAPQWLEDGD